MSASHSIKKYMWRYKITITFETPEGEVSGSAVRQIDVSMKPNGWDKLNKEMRYVTRRKTTGEAVVIDLGKRGVLFAPLDWTASEDVVNAFGMPEYSKITKLPAGKTANFDPKKYPGGPQIVIFSDISDPKSVKSVLSWSRKDDCMRSTSCFKKNDNTPELFSGEVLFKGITITMTNKDVTWKVRNYLPWLDNFQNRLLDGNEIHTIEAKNQLANSLGAGSFSTRRMR